MTRWSWSWSWSWARSRLPLGCLLYAGLFVFLLRKYRESDALLAASLGLRQPLPPPHSPQLPNPIRKRAETWWDYEDFLTPHQTPKNVTILMWTEYYHNKDLTDHVRNESPIPAWCNVTFDRSKREKADALVFHTTGSDTHLHDLPPRLPRQPWVFYTIEPPVYMSRDTNVFNGLFNRTMTYRLDSDYPCPYGYLVPRQRPLPTNPYWDDPLFPRASKRSLVAWMVSHCSTLSRRERIADQLKTHLPLHVYGSCGKLTCTRSDEEGCYKRLGQQYKFYLSFENSLCTDYITEKFSNALKYGMVPVVFGGGNYSAILPHPRSYIDAREFSTVAKLAAFLKYLDGNETAYAEYFQWRQFYRIHIRQGFAGFRRMCYALQQPQKHHVYNDITYLCHLDFSTLVTQPSPALLFRKWWKGGACSTSVQMPS